MKAIVLRSDSIEIEDIDEVPLLPGQAKIEMMYAGLCGSDINRFNNYNENHASVLGHEGVGRIVEVNNISNEVSIKIGDVVVACPTLACGNCTNCNSGNDHICNSFHAIGRDLPGAFAEYMNVPFANIHKLSDNENYRYGVLADIVAVCLHAVDDVAQDVKNKNCLVIGDGAIGAMLAAILYFKEARKISIFGKHKENQNLVSSICAIQSISEKESPGDFDYVFETVGRSQMETINQAIMSVGIRGMIVALGVFPPNFVLSFNNRDLFLKEARLSSSVAYKQKYFPQALKMLEVHPELESLITQEISFEEFKKGLIKMNNKKEYAPVIKVVYSFDKHL